MYEPHSLYVAAKDFLAPAAGIPWAELQKTYRALQDAPRGKSPWLPKSVGRRVWCAHPNFIHRLLVAHVASNNSQSPGDTLDWMQSLTLRGKAFDLQHRPAANVPAPIATELNKYLVDAAEAQKLRTIEVHPADQSIIFNVGNRSFIWLPASDAEKSPAPPVINNPEISGRVFLDIAKQVRWGFGPNGEAKLMKNAPSGTEYE
jgi:hypothetical protein